MVLLMGCIPNLALASENDYSSKKTYTLETQTSTFNNSLWGLYASGNVTSKTMKIKVPTGTLFIDSKDSATAFSITITDSKKKTIKTLKSKQEEKPTIGEDIAYHSIENGVALSKGTYLLTFKSTGKKKLNGYASLIVLSDKSKEINIMNENEVAVVKDKTYSYNFNIENSGKYSVDVCIAGYDINNTGLTDVNFNILNADGKKIASRSDDSGSLETTLAAGDYVLEVTPSKSGILTMFASED
jgi:hypothetical protein